MDHSINPLYPYKFIDDIWKFGKDNLMVQELKQICDTFPNLQLDYSKEWEIPWLLYHMKERIKKDSYVLDAGCGTSPLPYYLYKKGLNSYGIDISQDLSKGWTIPKGIPHVNYDIQDMCSIQYESNFFDIVLSVSVIEHMGMEKSIQALSELTRVTKPNGYIGISFDLYLPKFSHTGYTHEEILSLINNTKNVKLITELSSPSPVIQKYHDKFSKEFPYDRLYGAFVLEKV